MTIEELRQCNNATKSYEFLKAFIAYRNVRLIEFRKELINRRNFLTAVMSTRRNTICTLRFMAPPAELQQILDLCFNEFGQVPVKGEDDCIS